MNTFMVCYNHHMTARSLDYRRLNKQIVEGMQLCNIILDKCGIDKPEKYRQTTTLKGWYHHPVLKLWSDDNQNFYLSNLINYIDIMFNEWSTRPQCRKVHSWAGVRQYYIDVTKQYSRAPLNPRTLLIFPTEFYTTMRANLLRKDYKYYSSMFKRLDLSRPKPTQGYIWVHPTKV